MAEEELGITRRSALRKLAAGTAALFGVALVGRGSNSRSSEDSRSPSVAPNKVEFEQVSTPEFVGIEDLLPEGKCTRDNSVLLCYNQQGMNNAESLQQPIFEVSSNGFGFKLPDGKSTQSGNFFYTDGQRRAEGPPYGSSVYSSLGLLKTQTGDQYLEVLKDISDANFVIQSGRLEVEMDDGTVANLEIYGTGPIKKWDDKSGDIFLKLGAQDSRDNLPKNVLPLKVSLDNIKSLSYHLTGITNGVDSSVEFQSHRK